MSTSRMPRSYLYVPGNAAEKLTKALDRGADALILDLEDAVPMAEKAKARADVVRWVRGLPADLQTEIWVRVNPGSQLVEDVMALVNLPALAGIAIAKCESLADVQTVDVVLSDAGDQSTRIMPLIETAPAVLDAVNIARGPRVHQLQIGEVDLAAETGITPGETESELSTFRALIVLASTAAGIHPPLGPVSRITNDDVKLAESTRRVKRQGFLGRACIHPAQVQIVHEVFTPTPQEVAEAREVVSAFDEAELRGSGVVLDSGGRLIDLAVLRGARKTLALAEH